MNGAKNSKALKWIVGIGAPILAISMAAVFGLTGKTPPCIFYQLTGLHCPGCGTGRSLLALLRLDFYSAFRYQPLFFLTYPLIGYYLMKWYLEFLTGRPLFPTPKITKNWPAYLLISAVLLYWVLRNIPIAPFIWLSPTSV